MVTKRMVGLLAFMGLFPIGTFAAPMGSTTASLGANPLNVNNPVGWFPFVSLSGGRMSQNSTYLTGGAPRELTLLASHFSEDQRRIFDFGFGLRGDRFTDSGPGKSDFQSGGVAEIAWRYNTLDRWQAGPVLDAFIGGGDRYGSSDPTWTTFAGLQVFKEFPIKGVSMFRVGLKALTDVSIPKENVNTLMLNIQMGFGTPQVVQQASDQTLPYNQGGEVVEETILGVAEVMPETPPALSRMPFFGTGAESHRVIESDPEAGTVTVRDETRLQFKTNSAKLNPRYRAFAERLAAAVADRYDLFQSVEVVGHADQTGPAVYNMKLSKERALYVAGLLRGSGLAKREVISSWKGATNPLYQSLLPEDLQQNRRVDIIFHGVKDPAELEQYLASIL